MLPASAQQKRLDMLFLTRYTEKSARGGAVEARWAHNPKVAGSNPAPATKKFEADQIGSAFIFSPEKQYNSLVMESKVTDPNLQAILTALQKLSQADREKIIEALQPKPSGLLQNPGEGYEDWRNELRLRGLAEGTIQLYSRTVRAVLGYKTIQEPTGRLTKKGTPADRYKLPGRPGIIPPIGSSSHATCTRNFL